MLIWHPKDKAAVNRHGHELINLCKDTGTCMLILKGRVGDYKGVGEYTREDTMGRSVVDYVITCPKPFAMFSQFKVLPKLPESDHKAIAFTIDNKMAWIDTQMPHNITWKPTCKYKFSAHANDEINVALHDEISMPYRNELFVTMSELSESDTVAHAFDQYLYQAVIRNCQYMPSNYSNKHTRKLPWYDKECRSKRAIATQAGERVQCEADRIIQNDACRDYRACKQKKNPKYRKSVLVR